jgi:hypothetical protein
MDGVRGHAGWPPDDTLLGWDQRERSGAKHWQRLHDTPLQAVGISTCHQLGSPFRESSSASVKRRGASAASFLKVNGFCFSCAHPISNKGLRASHRKRPRQIFDHQKLHSSVCLHKEDANPLAYLPDSWIYKPEEAKRYDWTDVIKLLRNEVDTKDKAADASKSGPMVLPPLEFSPTPSSSRPPSIAPVQPPSGPPSPASEPPSPASVNPPSTIASAKKHAMLPMLTTAIISPQVSRSTGTGKSGRTRKRKRLLPSMFVRPRKGAKKQGSMPPPPSVGPEEFPLSALTPMTALGNSFTLPNEAIELDLLDCDGIPALIVGVLRGTNVTEFLERLEVLAYTGTQSDYMLSIFLDTMFFGSENGRTTIRQHNRRQFSSMLQQVCNNKNAEYTGLAIRVAYEVFWHSGESQSFCDIYFLTDLFRGRPIPQ